MEQVRNQHRSQKASKAKAPRIKYISSPMMVKASNASEFRAIVQHLTGQDSDTTSYDQEPSRGGDSEQASWVSSDHHQHQASKPDMTVRFSEEPGWPAADLDQLINENKLWEAVAETLSSYKVPCVYV